MDAARKKGRELPDWYLAEPPSPAGCEFFYTAFRDLVTERRFEGGPIPWGAAMAYAGRQGLEHDVAGVLWSVVRRMDNTERSWRAEQLATEAGGGGD